MNSRNATIESHDPPDDAAFSLEAEVRRYLAGGNRLRAVGECQVQLNCDFDLANEIVRLIEKSSHTTDEIHEAIQKAAKQQPITGGHRDAATASENSSSQAGTTTPRSRTHGCRAGVGAVARRQRAMVAPTSHKLNEHPATKCPKCEGVFFGKVDTCTQCGHATEPTKCYSRFCVERLAFIGTVASICGVGAMISGEDGGTILAVFFGTAFMLFAMYVTANCFLGIGGFEERFAEGAVPPRARVAFSWGRYLSEIFRIVGVFIALFVFVGLCMLFGWAFSGGD